METTNGIYYERRQRNVPLDSDERRVSVRRMQNRSFPIDRRRLAMEVRRFERDPLEIPVLLKTEEAEHSCYTQNISPGGISILSLANVDVGSASTLRFYLVDSPGMKVAGQVVYCRPVELKGSRLYLVGIKLWGINDVEKEMLKSSIEKNHARRLSSGNRLLSIHIVMEKETTKASNTF